MTLEYLLKHFTLPSDISRRLQSGEIRINNKVVTDKKFVINIQEGFWKFDEFMALNNIGPSKRPSIIKSWFGCPPEAIKKINFISGYTLVSISGNDYVFMNH